MAKITAGITTSHIPAIGVAMDNGLEETPYFKPFFDGYPPVRQWLHDNPPDVVVLFYNDHGLEFFLDRKPTFAMGVADKYENADEGWGIATIPPITGETELSWHIATHLIENDFDMTVCQEMKVDHGCTVPMSVMWPDKNYSHIKVIPVAINCERHPMPNPSRCLALGKEIGKAIESFDQDLNVVLFGTGGMSHQLDGQRAGFISREFDLWCMDKLITDPQAIADLSISEIIQRGGAQGVEINMWLAMRGALHGNLKLLHSNYYAPISNTATGLQLIEHSH